MLLTTNCVTLISNFSFCQDHQIVSPKTDVHVVALNYDVHFLMMQMTESIHIKLDQVCRELQIPLLCIRSYGLVGYLRVSLPYSLHYFMKAEIPSYMKRH